MVRWEYKILTAAYPGAGHGIHIVKYVDGVEVPDWKARSWYITEALNEYGREGWELVQVVWRNQESMLHDPLYILKRGSE